MRELMYESKSVPPRLRPVHNGLAITAFIVAWIIPLLGFILGCVSVSEAHSQGRDSSGLANWAVGLGMIFTVAYIIAVVVLTHDASTACNQLNPNWPNC